MLSAPVMPPMMPTPAAKTTKAANPAIASRVPMNVMRPRMTTLGARASPLTPMTPSIASTTAAMGSSSAAEPNIARR
ncbi:unannotated protein [freshwater metagenome]|uniref:Unannotated protein n=1 Tax=freshwater metagenome TaxID=449393 RepID=A0A6J7QBU5_9ZZZZ